MKHWGFGAYQVCSNNEPRLTLTYLTLWSHLLSNSFKREIFMPPKELWEAYSNRTVRPSVSPSVRPAFVSGPYLLYSLR